MDSELYNLGKVVNTDKIYHHGYHRFYESIIKKDISEMLEIGISQGNSLKLWLEYLPKCYIWGVDINYELKGERFTILKGDQSNPNDLDKIKNIIGENKIDLIIDDGSHIPEHQVLTFKFFFEEVLKNGGIYVIEDIETSYWRKNGLYGYSTNYGLHNDKNIVNIFSKLLHLINCEFFSNEDKQKIIKDINLTNKIVDSISTITFGQNCIIIKKKENYEYQYNNREYRWNFNL